MSRDLDAFMATMVTSSAPVSAAEAEQLALEHYALRAVAAQLTGERDENFQLTSDDGTQYVLKIANAAEPPSVTDLPTAALLHVEAVDATLPCPRVLRCIAGGTLCRWQDVSGQMRTLRVVSYLPGKPLRLSLTRSRAQRSACGAMAARLGVALREFSHPAAQRALIWDLRHVGKTAALLDELPSFPDRDTVASSIERVAMLIAIRFQRLRQQVIHNDLNDMNLLVDPADEAVLVGVIDFGDLVHTALVSDVAVVAADHIVGRLTGAGSGYDAGAAARESGERRRDADGGTIRSAAAARDPDTARGAAGTTTRHADTVRGATTATAREAIADIVMAYHEITPLLPQELVLLNPLIAARILSDVVIASWHRHRNPSGTHYSDLDVDVIRARVALAEQLLATDMPL